MTHAGGPPTPMPDAAGVEHWYVYYPAPAAGLLDAVRSMQRQLAATGGVETRLEQRIGAATPTWMEVYQNVRDPASFDRALAAALAASGLPPELHAARRVERFRPL
jgi:hypothetical protein